MTNDELIKKAFALADSLDGESHDLIHKLIAEMEGSNMTYTLDAGRCIVKDGTALATIHGVGNYDPCEVDSLARLFAAAPELLEALKVVRNAPAFHTLSTKNRTIVESAIAKAEGKAK